YTRLGCKKCPLKGNLSHNHFHVPLFTSRFISRSVARVSSSNMTSLRSDISTATPATHSSHIRVMATQIQPTNDTNATLPLPNELLQHIFTLALEPAHETTLPTSTPLAWPVLQVCGHWREIALSLPQLWSTVVVSTGSIDIRHQNLLQLQLERSRNAPLDIVLRMTYKYHWQDSDFDGGLHGILKLLAAVCFRWQSIHISIDVDYRLPASFTAIDTLPVLEEVTFSGGAVSRLDRLGWKLLFPQCAEAASRRP
ncbi:hypothetical protein C8F01DRAFT_450307, partial [Mycena amicta]